METIVRRIGLVAHDAMKKDMIEWVLWNSERLITNVFTRITPITRSVLKTRESYLKQWSK